VEPACPFQRDQRIIYFASRGCMDIEGLGEKTVFALSDLGLVSDAGDLYSLTMDDLLRIEGFGELSASNLLAGIEKSKGVVLPKLLTALGIKHLGPAAAGSITKWFADKSNRKIVDKLRKGGVRFDNVVVSSLPQTLLGKAVVVTGTIEGYSREEAEAAIKARGGKSPGSVSAKTFCVVVGEAPGASKITKATEIGVPVVQAGEFERLLETGLVP